MPRSAAARRSRSTQTASRRRRAASRATSSSRRAPRRAVASRRAPRRASPWRASRRRAAAPTARRVPSRPWRRATTTPSPSWRRASAWRGRRAPSRRRAASRRSASRRTQSTPCRPSASVWKSKSHGDRSHAIYWLIRTGHQGDEGHQGGRPGPRLSRRGQGRRPARLQATSDSLVVGDRPGGRGRDVEPFQVQRAVRRPRARDGPPRALRSASPGRGRPPCGSSPFA